jgi:hypothetical protein
MAQESWSDEDVVGVAPETWTDADVVPAAATQRHNGLVPKSDEDQGALVRRRVNALLQGVGGTANYLADLGARAGNSLGARDPNTPLPSARFANFLGQLGLDQPKPAESLVGGMLGGMADPAAQAMRLASTRNPAPQPNMDPLGRALPENVQPARNPLETPTRTAAREQGMAAGYQFAPTDVPKTPAGNVAEYLAYPPQVKADISRTNVRKLNEAVSDQLTLPTGEGLGRDGLTPDALRKLSTAAWERGYKPIADMNLRTPLQANDVLEISRLTKNPDIATRVSTVLENAGGHKTSGGMLTSIRDLRKSADKLYKTDPEMATALKDVAGVLEGRLSSHLASVPGGTEAFDNYVQMRSFIAQVKTARRALGPGGNINATKLYTAANKDVPLTGALRTGADMGENFPDVMSLANSGEELLTQRTTGPVGNMLYRAVTLAGYPLRKQIQTPGYQQKLTQGRLPNVASPFKTQALFGAANQADDLYNYNDKPAAPTNLFQPE